MVSPAASKSASEYVDDPLAVFGTIAVQLGENNYKQYRHLALTISGIPRKGFVLFFWTCALHTVCESPPGCRYLASSA